MRIPSDSYLVQQTLAGKTHAFEGLVRRHLTMVEAFAMARLGPQSADLDDVVQDTFVQAYCKLDTLRDARRFTGWLLTIARTQCSRLLRARKPTTSLEDAESELRAEPASIETGERAALVQQELLRLMPEQREVLALYYFAQKSTREIGRVLEISPAAVRKRLERARNALGEGLMANLPEEYRPKPSDKDRVAGIMAAVGAMPAPWPVTAGTSRGLGSWFAANPMTTIGGMCAVGLAVVAAAFLLLKTHTGEVVEAVGAEREVSASQITTPIEAGTPIAAPIECSTQEPAFADAPEDRSTGTGSLAKVQRIRQAMAEKTQAALEQNVSVSFTGEHLESVVPFIHEYTRVDFVMDFAEIPGKSKEFDLPAKIKPLPWCDSYVTDGMLAEAHLESTPLGEALEELLHPLALDFVVNDELIWVSTPDVIKRDFAADSEEGYAETHSDPRLDKKVLLDFSETHIEQILEYLSQFTQTNIVVDSRVVAPFGVNRMLPDTEKQKATVRHLLLDRVPVSQALQALIRPLDLSYRVEGDFVWISTPARIADKVFDPTEPYSPILDESAVGRMQFYDVAIVDTLEYLAGYLDITIAADASLAYSTELPTEQNCGLLTRIPWIDRKNATLRSVLDSVLRPYGLDYRVVDGAIAVCGDGAFDNDDHEWISVRDMPREQPKPQLGRQV